jgi:hypothetical protein
MPLLDRLLERHERERHRRILSRPLPPRRFALADEPDGFMPPRDAATAMLITEAEVVDLARRGLLEWRDVHGAIWIRPAVVSTLAVRTGGAQ